MGRVYGKCGKAAECRSSWPCCACCSASAVTASLPTATRGPADRRTKGGWSSCWDSPASSSKVAAGVCSLGHTCSYTHSHVQLFSYSETFPYQGDDGKYEKQTSICNLKRATSGSFTACQYSL